MSLSNGQGLIPNKSIIINPNLFYYLSNIPKLPQWREFVFWNCIANPYHGGLNLQKYFSTHRDKNHSGKIAKFGGELTMIQLYCNGLVSRRSHLSQKITLCIMKKLNNNHPV